MNENQFILYKRIHILYTDVIEFLLDIDPLDLPDSQQETRKCLLKVSVQYRANYCTGYYNSIILAVSMHFLENSMIWFVFLKSFILF